ncbi:MAG: glycosyltransferase [Lachnospiraceae bacterium]|nr:glycosyltransferase [Lachnospiraceae bacterium]
MDKVAVLIPCFNEGKTIEKVVRDFHTVLPEASIYVYDNNSTDDTCFAARRGWEGVIIRKEYKQGKGNVIRRMFREVDAQCYIMADGDDTYPAEYAPQMAEAVIERGADMVVGDRLSSTYYTENKRPFHNTGNTLVRKLVNWIFKCEFKDIMTGYRAFSFSFVKGFPVLSGGFEIETEMSIHAADHNLRVENVVVEYRDRPAGSESKLNTFSDGFKVLKTIGKMFRTYRPLIYFGIIALTLMALSLGFFIPVFITFLKEGIVEKIPTMIVCGFAMMAALLSLFTGLELETIRSKNKQDFEFQLKVMDLHYKQLLQDESRKLPEAGED